MRPARIKVAGRYLTEFGPGWLDTVYAATYSRSRAVRGAWIAHVPGRACVSYASLGRAVKAVSRSHARMPRRPNR